MGKRPVVRGSGTSYDSIAASATIGSMSRSTVPCPVTSPVGRTIAYPSSEYTRSRSSPSSRTRSNTPKTSRRAIRDFNSASARSSSRSPVIHESGSNAASHSSALIRAMSEGPNSSKSYSVVDSLAECGKVVRVVGSVAATLVGRVASGRFAAVGLVRRPVRRRLRIRFGRGVLHCPPVRAPDANCFVYRRGDGRPGRSAPESQTEEPRIGEFYAPEIHRG